MTQNSNKIKRFAIIDIGSVAIRSEIYSININSRQFNSELIYSKSYLPKLGNLDEENKISSHSLNLAKEYISEIKSKFIISNIDYLKVVGTAVFRQAQNATIAIQEIESVLDDKLQVLTEEEEANFIARGIAAFETQLPTSYLLLDIGGRSSELTFVNNSVIAHSHSFPIGAIAVRNNYFTENVPRKDEAFNTGKQIRSILSSEIEKYKNKSPLLIGSSGTIRMIGRFFNSSYPELNEIPVTFLDEVWNQLMEDPHSVKNNKLFSLEKNRHELIYSGILLAKEFCKALNVEKIRVTNFSLRHGILFNLAQKYFNAQ